VVLYYIYSTRREVVVQRILERVRRTDIFEDRLISDQLPPPIQPILNNGRSKVNTWLTGSWQSKLDRGKAIRITL